MKNAIRVYGLLLRLYPRGYREAFGAQMLRTFVDWYADAGGAEGRVGVRFWFSLVADELRNVVRQHGAALAEGDGHVRVSVGRAAVAAVFAFPLFAAFWGLVVKLALALPHPPVSGIFAVVALATVALVIPGVLGVAVSWVLAGALLRIWAKRKGRGASHR
jgi:hypothetical protein